MPRFRRYRRSRRRPFRDRRPGRRRSYARRMPRRRGIRRVRAGFRM